MDLNGIQYMFLPIISTLSTRYPTITCVIFILTFILQRHEFAHNIFDNFNCVYSWLPFTHRKLIKTGRLICTRYSTICHITDDMKGVFYYLHKNIDKFNYISNVEAIDIESSSDNDRKTLNVPVQKQWVPLHNGIEIMVERIRDETDHSKPCLFEKKPEVHTIILSLRSQKLSYVNIDSFVQDCVREYAVFVKSGSSQQMWFMYHHDEDTNEPLFKSGPFETTKTMNNTFFDGKEDIIARINMFQSTDGVEHSRKIGMPHRMALLLHGEPGCGKTSFIKMVAHLTQRHVIIIPLGQLFKHDTCINILRDLIFSDKIGDAAVPHNKRLYVFEEADIAISALKERRSKGKKRDEPNENIASITDILKINGQGQASADDSGKYILESMLNLLDGIIETPNGFMCITTTNHIDRLDPALKRSGRLGDIVYEFKKLTKTNVRDNFKLWFEKDLPSDIFDKMVDFIYTQAELGQLFRNPNHDEIFQNLKTHNIHLTD